MYIYVEDQAAVQMAKAVVYIGEAERGAALGERLPKTSSRIKLGDRNNDLNRISNKAEPHFRTIRKLAKALDVDPTEL